MAKRGVPTTDRSENRKWWDERARLHGDDPIYDASAFLAGRSTLYEIDYEITGEVTGLDVIHLQCHTGMDTLSWLRAGARRVVGVDFSPVAIDKATALAQSAGLADRAQFHVADVLDLPGHLRGAFDVCYASRGVLCWIEDLNEWMRQAAGVLKPGGRLVLVDMHPLFLMADSVDPLVLDFPYAAHGPQRFTDQAGSYALPEASTAHNSTTEYAHCLGEIVTAAIVSGLTVNHLGEHLAVETDGHRGLATRESDGLMRWRHTEQPLPIMFSLRALKADRKPAKRAATREDPQFDRPANSPRPRPTTGSVTQRYPSAQNARERVGRRLSGQATVCSSKRRPRALVTFRMVDQVGLPSAESAL